MTETTLSGTQYLKQRVKTLPQQPGVYQMYGVANQLLYIGKAKCLARRVNDYTNYQQLSARIGRMVSQVLRLEFIITKTEAEALLLEANLVKQQQPKYNILLKDDKSYPFVVIDNTHQFPRVVKYRGKVQKGKDYYGPFASARAVDIAIAELQKLFLLRPCTDNYFASRTRPCLQYQIKRCSGPCVGKISQNHYTELVDEARAFLNGKASSIRTKLTKAMEAASQAQHYEQAAILRDRLKALTTVQARQYITIQGVKDADIIAITGKAPQYCVQVFFIRGGQHYGSRSYFPSKAADSEIAEVFDSFLGQFYQFHHPPKLIMVNQPIEFNIFKESLSQLSGYRVQIEQPKRGNKAELMQTALMNAQAALEQHLNTYHQHDELFRDIAKIFNLKRTPRRIEVYDNSHISGKHAVGAMVVANHYGLCKDEYRKFNLKTGSSSSTGGDDLAMHQEVIRRRLTRLKRDCPEYTEEVWPDLLIIDGGRNQLNAVIKVVDELELAIPVIAMAKGEFRDKGDEVFWQLNQEPFSLPNNNPTMQLLQRLRDEVHRYAITTHRSSRTRAMRTSMLDNIPGIGAKRRRDLINHFGSVEAIANATLEQLTTVNGINNKVGKDIVRFFGK